MTEKLTRPSHTWTKRAAPDGKPSAPPTRYATAPRPKAEWEQLSVFEGLTPDEVKQVFKPAELMMIRIMTGKNGKPSFSGIALDLRTTTGFVLQLVENVERKAKAIAAVPKEGRAALIQSFSDEPEIMIPIATMDGNAIFERMEIAAARTATPAPKSAAPEKRLEIGKTTFKTLADLGDMSRDELKRFEGRPELLQLIDKVGSLKRKEATPANLATLLGKDEADVTGMFDEIKAAFLKRVGRKPEGQTASFVPASLPQTSQEGAAHDPAQTDAKAVAPSSHAETGGVDPDWEKKIPASLPAPVALEQSVKFPLLHAQDAADAREPVRASTVQSPAPKPVAKPAKAGSKIHIDYEDLASIRGKYLPMLGLSDDENAMVIKAGDMPPSYISKTTLADEMDGKTPGDIALLKSGFEKKVSLFLRSHPDVTLQMLFPDYTSSREAAPDMHAHPSGTVVGNLSHLSAEQELMAIYLNERKSPAPSASDLTVIPTATGMSAEEELMQLYLKEKSASTSRFSAATNIASSEPAAPAVAEVPQPAVVAASIALPAPVIESVPEPAAASVASVAAEVSTPALSPTAETVPAPEPIIPPYLREENHPPAVRKLLDNRREVHVQMLAKLPAYVLRNEQLQGEQRTLIEQIFAMRDAGEEPTVAALVAKSSHSARDTEKLIDQTAQEYMPIAEQLAPVEQARLNAQRAQKTAAAPAANGKETGMFGDLTPQEIALAFKPEEQRVIRYSATKQPGQINVSQLSTEMEIPAHVLERMLGTIRYKLHTISETKTPHQRKLVIQSFAKEKGGPRFMVTGPHSSHYLPSGKDTSDKGR